MTRRIIIEAVAASQHRYDTVGDWFTDESGDIVIRATGVDPLGHDEAFLVALHELVEMKLCHKAVIMQEAVDAFDISFKGESEPGDDPKAPYREQHRQAMLIEHLMANFLGLTRYGEIS